MNNTDCDCGCNEPIATTPQEMLEFLAHRFEYAGVITELKTSLC